MAPTLVFADWRFIHKARPNLLPLNGCQQWKAGYDKLCRRCSQWPEKPCLPFKQFARTVYVLPEIGLIWFAVRRTGIDIFSFPFLFFPHFSLLKETI
ncbi:hypothetical protein CEXT_179261 [Caerostris extrusa]|uniref:Uncharacterized protein n=1 Tax=Caerostris extrusa TaxID=172846 RepID=A0AAV4QWF4_CAEEX|nr:hypothetical protein CEXT_179261 [Caerostris extrusa]